MSMIELQLNDGNDLPIIGFGTYSAIEEEGIQAVLNAIHNNYRLFDTAAFYRNEEAVGKGIKRSGIPRSDVFITTKLWRENLGYESARTECEKSLKKLDTDYIDLYLIHWPANAKNYDNWQRTNAETWSAMEEMQAEGKIRSIGVSNFWQVHLEALFKTAKKIPAVNQIEFHPGYWQAALTDFCKKHKILVQSWSPLARGRIADNKIIKEIARKHGKTFASICLRWIIQHEVAIIPKTTTIDRMKENIDLFDFELTDEEMKRIDNIPESGFSGELPDNWPDIV